MNAKLAGVMWCWRSVFTQENQHRSPKMEDEVLDDADGQSLRMFSQQP